MGNMFEPNVQEFMPPGWNQAQDWFRNLTGTTPQSQTPNMPLSQQAGQQMSQQVSRYGPEMEKFFYGMMQHGGMADVNNIMRNIQDIGGRERQQTMETIMSAGLPRGTAQSRAVTGALTDADLQRQLMMGQLGLGAHESAMGRRFGGAQGLGGMPGFYAQPSSLELQMIGARTPYDMANLGAQLQERGDVSRWQQAAGLMQPERVMEPSPFDRFAAPIMNAGMSILPFLL